MLTGILAFFQAIPALMGGINNFISKYFDAKVQITAARIGGDTAIAKAMVSGVVAEGQLRVSFLETVGHSKFLMVLIGSFAFPWVVYEWKVVLYDNIISPAYFGYPGFTNPIGGHVGDWGGVIITAIFGSATVASVGQMYFNRKNQ